MYMSELKKNLFTVTGLPVLIVTITLASASGKYSADGHCWLSVQNGVIWGFAGPVIFIIMVNFPLYFLLGLCECECVFNSACFCSR